jgi:hypothetical protein
LRGALAQLGRRLAEQCSGRAELHRELDDFVEAPSPTDVEGLGDRVERHVAEAGPRQDPGDAIGVGEGEGPRRARRRWGWR